MIRRLLLLPPALAVAAFQRLSQIHSHYRYVSRRGSGFFFFWSKCSWIRVSAAAGPPFLPAKPRPPGASGQETEDLEDSPLAWLADFEADAAALAADSGGEEWA